MVVIQKLPWRGMPVGSCVPSTERDDHIGGHIPVTVWQSLLTEGKMGTLDLWAINGFFAPLTTLLEMAIDFTNGETRILKGPSLVNFVKWLCG